MAIALAWFWLGGVSMADCENAITNNNVLDHIASITVENTTTYYCSLREAIAGANAGDTIEMLADDEVSFSAGTLAENTLTLTIDKNLTINGNGKTIKWVNALADLNWFNDCSAGTDDKVWHAIEIKADVVISGLNITEFWGNYYTNLCITPIREVSWTLTLNNVKIDKFNRDAITVEWWDFTIKNSEIEWSIQANLWINNSSCQSSWNPVICTQYQRAIAVDSNGIINIESTEIKNMTWNWWWWEWNYPVYSIAIDGNTTTATIKDTVITADDDTKNSAWVRVYAAGGSVTLQNVTISLPDYDNNNILFTRTAWGTITVESGLYSGSIPAQNWTLIIQWWRFSADPNSYVVAWKVAILNTSTSLYEVDYDCENAVARINNEYCYASLADAVNASTSGDTIILLADDHNSFSGAADTLKVTIDKALSINGWGFTIYWSGDYAFDDANYHEIFISASAWDVTIENLTFSGFGVNSAVTNGNIVPIYASYSYNWNLTLDGVNFKDFNNRALVLGNWTVAIKNCTFEWNKTPESAYFQQAIEVWNANVTIETSTINNMWTNMKKSEDDLRVAGAIQLGNGGLMDVNWSIIIKDWSYNWDFSLVIGTGAGWNITVNWGNFVWKILVESGVTGTFEISAWKFSVDPSVYVVAGKYAKQTSDATYPYEVVTKPTSSGGGGGWNTTYSCKNLPDNAVANNSKTPSSNTNYSYSTDTTKVCTFQCKTGYTWDADQKACDKASTWTVADTGATADTGTLAETWANEEIEDTTVDPELTDIENQDWYDNGDQKEVLANGYTREMNNAYEFAFRAGITTMKSIEEANMEWSLTRIAMAKMLSQYAINVLGKKADTNKKCEFSDVSAELDAQYNNWVTLACQLGIMWVWITNFRPNDDVVRAEFGTALSRLLFWLSDGEEAYYTTHLAKLKAEWIIQNDDPTLEELRWYVMLMLMRSAK